MNENDKKLNIKIRQGNNDNWLANLVVILVIIVIIGFDSEMDVAGRTQRSRKMTSQTVKG